MMQTGIYMLLFYCNRSVPDHDTWYTLSKNMERVILWWIYSDINPMYCLQLDGRMQSLSAKSTSPFDQECVASFLVVSTDFIYCHVDNREWVIVQENVYPFRREGYFLVSCLPTWSFVITEAKSKQCLIFRHIKLLTTYYCSLQLYITTVCGVTDKTLSII